MKKKIEGKVLRKILKEVSSGRITKLLNGDYDLMLEEQDQFIMKNFFYNKKSALNTAIKLGGYTENGIMYRIDKIIIKNNYDEILRFLTDMGEIENTACL